jgi:hypothetical protein
MLRDVTQLPQCPFGGKVSLLYYAIALTCDNHCD